MTMKFIYGLEKCVNKSVTMEHEFGSNDCLNSSTFECLNLEESANSNGDFINNLHVQVLTGHQEFDTVIGHIEDLLIDEGFKTLLDEFMEKYWTEFESNDENKLCYTTIFKEYTDIIEKHIELHLVKTIPNFSMDIFTQNLLHRKNDLDGEIFEMLFTLSDFEAFKEMFLDYKAIGGFDSLCNSIVLLVNCSAVQVKEGTTEDLTKCLTVTPVAFD